MTAVSAPAAATAKRPATLADSPLVALGRLRSFKKRDVLFAQDTRTRDAALILRGIVKVSAVSHGLDTMLGIRTGGELAGEELAILLPSDTGCGRRKATALTSVRAILLEAGQLRDYLDEHPADLATLTRDLCQRLADEQEHPVNSSGPAKARVARVLCRLHGLHPDVKRRGRGAELPVQLTQAEIASWIGTCRESVDKALHEFDVRGLISRNNGKIAVQDPDSLARIARTM